MEQALQVGNYIYPIEVFFIVTFRQSLQLPEKFNFIILNLTCFQKYKQTFEIKNHNQSQPWRQQLLEFTGKVAGFVFLSFL